MISETIYTKEYAKETLQVILDNLKDLSLWSAYNQDKYNDIIVNLQTVLEGMKENV